MKYITAIVLAAGKGLRMKSAETLLKADKIHKPLVKINSKPIIIYCLNTLSRHPYIRDIIVVANNKNFKNIVYNIDKYKIKKIRDIVLGGKLRQNSVYHGLKAIDNRTDLVLIHDAVRPFINKDVISSLIKVAEKSGAAIVGVPVKATIKKVTRSPCLSGRQAGHQVTRRSVVEKTIERKDLCEIQTPQVFRKDLILKAYKKFRSLSVTDDSMLVEKLGAKVSVVRGSYNNIKITTPEDLLLAKVMAQKGLK